MNKRRRKIGFNIGYIFIFLFIIAMALSIFNVRLSQGSVLEESSVDNFVGMVITTRKTQIQFDENGKKYGQETTIARDIKTIDFDFENLGSIYMVRELEDGEMTQHLSGNDPFSNVHIRVVAGQTPRYIIEMDYLLDSKNEQLYRLFKIYQDSKGGYFITNSEGFNVNKETAIGIEGNNDQSVIEYKLDLKAVEISYGILVTELDKNLNSISNQTYTFEDLPKALEPQNETMFFMVTQAPELKRIENNEQLRIYGRESDKAIVYIKDAKTIKPLEIPIKWNE